jgi:hypothetical protein
MSSAENLPGLVVLATDGDLSALDEMSAALAADPRVERVLRARDVAEALTTCRPSRSTWSSPRPGWSG